MSETSKAPDQLDPQYFGQAEHRRAIYMATVPKGTTKEQLQQPGYWAHVAAKIRPWSRIDVQAEDGSFFAELLVLATDRTWARVRCLSFHNLTDTEMSQSDAAKIMGDYEIKWRGPKKWSVVRRNDSSVINENMHNEADARKWLEVHINTQGINV